MRETLPHTEMPAPQARLAETLALAREHVELRLGYEIERAVLEPIERDGRMNLRVPFAPKESFGANFLRLLGGPSFEASVHFLPPVPLSDDGRRQTAETARTAIAHALGCADA